MARSAAMREPIVPAQRTAACDERQRPGSDLRVEGDATVAAVLMRDLHSRRELRCDSLSVNARSIRNVTMRRIKVMARLHYLGWTSILDFVWRCDSGGKAGPCFVGEQLRRAEFSACSPPLRSSSQRKASSKPARAAASAALAPGVVRHQGAPNKRPQDTCGASVRNWYRARSRQARRFPETCGGGDGVDLAVSSGIVGSGNGVGA